MGFCQEHLCPAQAKHKRGVVERFPPLQHDLKVHEALLQHIWKLQETYGSYFMAQSQAWLDGMQKSARDREEKLRTMEEEWQRQRRNVELYASQAGTRRTPGITTGESTMAGTNGKS